MPSFKNPIPTNPILGDVNQIHDLFTVLAVWNPALAGDIPEGAKRLYEYTESGKTFFRFEKYVKGTWVKYANLAIDVTSIQGYEPSTSAKAGAIPVYNASGQLVGNITGNAATATKWAKPISIQVGGIAASSAQNMDGISPVTIPINQITINNAADNAINGTLTPLHGGTGRTDGASLNVLMASLSGNVLAKSYGWLGPLLAKNFATSLDSLIVQGNYYVSNSTTTNWDKNHFPSSGPYFNKIETDYSSNDVLQRYNGQTSGAWKRFSNNKGASFSGWLPLGYQSQFTTIYISKSGNDVNMGTSSSYPVLTFGRAMQVAYGLVQNGSSQPYIYFNFGEGDWGNITIRDCPFLVIFRPYDGGSATAYSTTLPVFGNITIEHSYFWFQTCVAGWLIASQGGFINITTGYKRLGGIQALNNAAVYIASQNAATNLIDFIGGGYVPFYALYGGIIYAQYVHLRLCGNLTTRFMYAAMMGRITIHNGQTIYDATAFSNSNRKYEFYQGAMFNSGQTNGNLSWLNALPGNQAGVIEDSCYINGRAMANVLKTGDTMTGSLTIKVNGCPINVYDTGFSRAAAPAANLYRRQYQMWDAQGACMGAIQAAFSTAQRAHMSIFAQRVISGATKYAEVGGAINNDGSSVGYAPTPGTSSNTTDIATTIWVRTFHAANTKDVSVNGSFTGATISSGTLNASSVTMSGDVAQNDSSKKIATTGWVRALLSADYLGMMAGTSWSQSYSADTWYSAPKNGFLYVDLRNNVDGPLTNMFRMGASTTSFSIQYVTGYGVHSTFALKKGAYFYFQRNRSDSSAYMYWCAASNAVSALSVAPYNDEQVSPGMGNIFLRIIGGEFVEAFGDLVSLADNLGLEMPDLDAIDFDTQSLTDFYESSLAKIEADYENGVASINEHFRNELQFVSYDAEKIATAMYTERDVTQFELSLAEYIHFFKSDIEREIEAKKGEAIVILQKAKQDAYRELQKQLVIKRSEFEDEYQRKVEAAYRVRDAACEKAASMADMIITIDTWEEYRCTAHLEDGKIVLGPTRAEYVEMLDYEAEKRLKKYDQVVTRLEREKRLANRALKRSKMGDTDALSRFAGKQDSIEATLEAWDMYAGEIAAMPDKKGYPWDGGGKLTPWPEEPTTA